MDDVPAKNDEPDEFDVEENEQCKEDNDEEKCKVVDDEAIEQQVKGVHGPSESAPGIQGDHI